MDRAASPSMAHAVRSLSMDAIERAGDGHPGTPPGAADVATAPFTRRLKLDPADPLRFDRDRFVQSEGHGSMPLHAPLYPTGDGGTGIEHIRRLRELGSPCEGHPERDPAHGIETSTGPLGRGIATAAGTAPAEAFHRLAPGVVDHRTRALVGDGCLREGVGQEVVSLAGHLRLGSLTPPWADDRTTDDGAIGLASRDDPPARLRASGWHMRGVDGHDLDALSAAPPLAERDPRPSLLACSTFIFTPQAVAAEVRERLRRRVRPRRAGPGRPVAPPRERSRPHGRRAPRPVRCPARAMPRAGGGGASASASARPGGTGARHVPEALPARVGPDAPPRPDPDPRRS